MTDSSAARKAVPATPPAARRAVTASTPRSAQARAAQAGTRSTAQPRTGQPARAAKATVPTPRAGTGRTSAAGRATAAGRTTATGRTSATGRTATSRATTGTTGRTAASRASTSATGRTPTSRMAAATGRTATGRTAAGRTPGSPTSRTPTSRTATSRTPTSRTATSRTAASRAAGTPARAGKAARPKPRPQSRARPKARRAAQRLRLGDPSRRLTVGFAAVCALLVVLGVRLVQLQTLDGPRYAAAALHPKLDVTVIPAERGRILDRDGHPLAYTVAARTVFADPKLAAGDAAQTAAALSPLLGIPAATLVPKLTKTGRYSILARDVTPTDAARILALKLPGIGADDATQRIYPGGQTAAGVIGFTGRDGTGLAGLELKYDDTLSGTDGKITTEAGKDGTEIPSGDRREVAAVPGASVRLTLDEDLQYMVQSALAKAVKDANAKDGQAVVLDARTGEVLAMASAPTYDAQKASSADPKTLGNPPVQSVFEPGSANKVVTFAAALDKGLIRPDSRLTVPGSIQISDRVVHDAWVHGPVNYTATGVLAKSSNVGTLMIANRLGPAAFYDYETKFGIGARTGVGLPGESAGLLPPPSTWSGSTFGNLPIGQGVSMTALQLAGMYQTIANDGVRVPPRIVAGVTGPDGKVTSPPAPAGIRVVSPAAARTVRGMLEAVTGKGGTAPRAAIDGYRVAGKTGTAQKPNPECKCYAGGGYWATFAGMAPATSPRFVVSIVIDEAKGGAHGGAVAAPLFHQIASYELAQDGVPPTGNSAQASLTWE